MVQLSELHASVALWQKYYDKPQVFNNDNYITLAILAYECLNRLPQDLLDEVWHRNYPVIHDYYYDGTLGSFVREYQMMRQSPGINIIAHYENDKYFFENLKRIIASLYGLLSIDADELFATVPKAVISNEIEVSSYVFVATTELSIKKTIFPFEKIASLSAEPSLSFRGACRASFESEFILIGYTSQKCFYWNPRIFFFPQYFYTAGKNKSIRQIFIEQSGRQTIIYIYSGNSIFKSVDFTQPVKTITLPKGINALSYHLKTKQFFGIFDAAIGHKATHFFSLQPDGALVQLLTSVDIFNLCGEGSSIREMIDIELKDYGASDIAKTFSYPFVTGGQLFSLTWAGEELIAIRVKLELHTRNTVLVIGKVIKDGKFEIISTLLAPGRLVSTLDVIGIDDDLNIALGYLSTGDPTAKLIQVIRQVNKRPFIEVGNEESFLATSGSILEDTYQVKAVSKNIVFAIQHARDLYEIDITTNKINKLTVEGISDILI